MNEKIIKSCKTPCYIVDETLLIKNIKILKSIQDISGCKILLAQKGFSMYSTYPLLKKYLYGVTSSSLFEARLGYEEMNTQVHIFAPAYRDDEFNDIAEICDHIVFNSFSQWNKFKAHEKIQSKKISCGIRINPEYSELSTPIYDPCAPYSRMGITLNNFEGNDLTGIDGLHFHTMCEQNSDTLWRTLQAVDEKFGSYIKGMKWINLGGGHHITRDDYDIDTLLKCIKFLKDKYNNIDVFLEPGEAVALNAGYLVTTVLDITSNGMDIAIVDTSAACHMPDVLEMPYRPKIIGADGQNAKHTYRLGAPTCLAGDIIGDYKFDDRLNIGDRLVFCDMAIYSMVKNNTFNGINLPSIYLIDNKKKLKLIKEFNYYDFRSRL